MNLKFLSLLVTGVASKVYFKETFDKDLSDRWVVSENKDDYGKWVVSPGKFYADKQASRGLQTSQDAKFYAISAPFDEEFDHKSKTFVVQFSVKHEQNIDCGGGYVKIIPKPFDQTKFHGETKYNVMFGPDVCGADAKTHVILNYKDKNHLIKKTIRPKTDQLTALYTLVINPDQTYKVLINSEQVESGSFEKDWDMIPPEFIPDPDAKKPDDWVDEAEIDDPEAKKPDDWVDGPETIDDADAKKPEDWDDEMDGEWERPKVPNPAYKGPWKAPRIANPAYKGVWKAPEIKNPEYKEDKDIYAYKSAFIGLDLWQVKSGTIFDNFIITDSEEEAAEFAKETFTKWVDAEKKAKDELDAAETKKLEEERKKAEAKEKEEKKEEKKEDEDEDEHEDL